MPKRYAMLVMADSRNNHNKFYEVTLADNDDVLVRYGRVDGGAQSACKGQGERTFDTVVRQKRAKGYAPVDVVVRHEDGKVRKTLTEVAKRDVAGNDPVLIGLIERLVQNNRHELLEASGGRITIEDGQVKTPVGLITMGSVQSAKAVLAQLQSHVQARRTHRDDYLELLDGYLRLVPQKVPRARGWGPTFFDEFTSFQKQNDMLEQLESSLRSMADQPGPNDDDTIPDERIFPYAITPVTRKSEISRIEAFFRSQANPRHVSSKLKLKCVYAMGNPDAEARYAKAKKRIGNQMRLWHGTRACNLLSILKSGLIIPKSSGGNYTISGRMFGDGLYFSDQSTKSLNYSYGYWGHGGVDKNCFMLLCDVAMGKPYTPSGPGCARRKGYHSCFAESGKSGVLNNEMIVYDIDQACLRYLCEFEEA